MKKKIFSLCLVVALIATAVVGGTLAYFTDTTENVENTFAMGKVKISLDETDINNPNGPRVKTNDYTGTAMVPGHVFQKDPTIHVEANSEESYIFLDMTFNKYSSLFWLMAADAAEDDAINFPLYENGELSAAFQNNAGVFSTTKFVEYLQDNKDARIAIVNKWFSGIVHENWTIRDVIFGEDTAQNGKSDKYMTIRFAYNLTTKKTNEVTNIKFMDSFQIPASVTPEMFEAAKTIGNMKNSFNTEENTFNMIFKAYAIQAAEINGIDDAYAKMFNK